MAPTLDIYLDPCTVNSRKVLAGLDLMQVPYNFHHIDYFTGQHKSEDYTKINPCQTVPAATYEEIVLNESNAILAFAADLVGSPAYPKDLKQRALVNRWLLFEASVWFPICYTYLVQNVVQPLLKAKPSQAVLDEAAPRFHQLANVLDAQLGKTKWIASNDITIADIALAAPMHLHRAQGLPLNKYHNLTRWLSEIEKLPSWVKTQGAVDKALLPGGTSVSTHSQIRTKVNYTKALKDRLTELYFYESEAAKGIHEPGDDEQEIVVHDGWHRAKSFSVDKEGFALQDFHSPFDDWENDEAVRQRFYPEVVEFLKKTVGASRVLVFDHTIRTQANVTKKLTQETNTSQRAPVMLVHCDYTAESGPVRVRQLLESEADDLLSRRVAFFNVWKPVRRVVEERPLAMCDVSSSPPDDFQKLYLRYRERTGENYVMKYSNKHQWYYFPRMTPDQVILLKTYESATDGRARFVGHSAIQDPNTPPDAATRESVEIRTIAFY